MLFAGAVHPHGSIVRPIIIHTVCICQFIPPHFSPNLHPMGCFPSPAAPCKPQNPGRRPPAAQRRANGLRPFRRLRRRACGPHPPPPVPSSGPLSSLRASLPPLLVSPAKTSHPGRRPPAAGRRANGLRPFRRLRRRACGPHPPQTFPPQTPPNRQKHPAGTAPPGDAFAVFGYLTRTSSYLRVPTPIFSACSRQVRQSVSGELYGKMVVVVAKALGRHVIGQAGCPVAAADGCRRPHRLRPAPPGQSSQTSRYPAGWGRRWSGSSRSSG